MVLSDGVIACLTGGFVSQARAGVVLRELGLVREQVGNRVKFMYGKHFKEIARVADVRVRDKSRQVSLL